MLYNSFIPHYLFAFISSNVKLSYKSPLQPSISQISNYAPQNPLIHGFYPIYSQLFQILTHLLGAYVLEHDVSFISVQEGVQKNNMTLVASS